MSEDNWHQHRLDKYEEYHSDETGDAKDGADGDDLSSQQANNRSKEVTDKVSAQADEWIESLRTEAIKHEWHLQQGKGRSSEATMDQDLLSHTMDVVHITYNIIEGMDITDDPPLDIQTSLSVAFFHDLHKLPEVGGTETMEKEEVKEVLSAWDVDKAILDRISLQEFTDVLRSIHQWHGNSDSRAAVVARQELLVLTSIVRLADMIASVERLDKLAGGGQYQDVFEPLEIIINNAAEVEPEYTLGYHRLSAIRPALSALVHEALYREFTDRGAILLGTRASGAVYAIPKSVDIATQDSRDDSEVRSTLIDAVTKRVRKRVFSSAIRDSIPDKLQEQFYGLEGAIKIRIDELQQAVAREKSLNHDIEGDIRDVAADLSNSYSDSYEVKVSDADDTDIIAVDNNSETVYIEHEMTEQGEIVGEALDQIMDAIGTEGDQFETVDSRIDMLDVLTGQLVDVQQFDDVYWSRVEAQLARFIGNQLESKSDGQVKSTLDGIKDRAVELVTAHKTQSEGSKESEGLRKALRKHLDENLNITVYKDREPVFASQVELPSDVTTGFSYDELCVFCGREASVPFQTSRGGEFKKSYLVRGEAGRDMTDANSGAWHLCHSCFLDNALFRASTGTIPSLRSIEDALFLKVVPNRYLGPERVANLRHNFAEGNAFGNISRDAERHLDSEYDLSVEEASLLDMLDEDVPDLTDGYKVNLSGSIVDQSGIIIDSPHYFVIAVEDDDDSPTSKETKTWLRALFRALVLSRYHNFSVVVGGQPTMLPDEYQLRHSGVHLNNPPSQIRSVFGDGIPYYDVDRHLTGLSALIYAEDNFPQYQSEGGGSFGPDQLTRAYSSFRRSILPGARMYRAAERDYQPDIPVGDYVDNAGLIARLLNTWRDQSGMAQKHKNPSSRDELSNKL